MDTGSITRAVWELCFELSGRELLLSHAPAACKDLAIDCVELQSNIRERYQGLLSKAAESTADTCLALARFAVRLMILHWPMYDQLVSREVKTPNASPAPMRALHRQIGSSREICTDRSAEALQRHVHFIKLSESMPERDSRSDPQL